MIDDDRLNVVMTRRAAQHLKRALTAAEARVFNRAQVVEGVDVNLAQELFDHADWLRWAISRIELAERA